ncbi:MAG: type II toxin-antitoxin system RelE/ParE family toxin [Bradyrhizobiaceae bacterium]|nr:type II toxin-antitoxin system RelE/ParE family toxin [Bradyrhizobiaceae bacterium]
MKVRYTLRAHADLDAIYLFLDERNPAAARSVKRFIEQRIAWLADFPYVASATDEPGIFELTITRYPYKVYYEVQGDEVWIVHIRHAARRPWPQSR